MDAENRGEHDEHLDRKLRERCENRKAGAQPLGAFGDRRHQLAVVVQGKRLIRRAAELFGQLSVQQVRQPERHPLHQAEQQNVGCKLHGHRRRQQRRFGEDVGQPRAHGVQHTPKLPSGQELRGGQQESQKQHARAAEDGRPAVKRPNKSEYPHPLPLLPTARRPYCTAFTVFESFADSIPCRFTKWNTDSDSFIKIRFGRVRNKNFTAAAAPPACRLRKRWIFCRFGLVERGKICYNDTQSGCGRRRPSPWGRCKRVMDGRRGDGN